MKHLPRALSALLLAVVTAASAQVSINAPNAPRAVTSADKLLVKLEGDTRGYLLPISSLPGLSVADGAITSAKLGGDIGTFGRSLVQAVNATAARITLGLVIGTDVQAYNASTTTLGNAVTGTGSIVLASSPTLSTPVLGVATATSINKLAITAPATSATLAVADGKTFTASNTLTLTGTDGSTLNVGTGGTLGALARVNAGVGVATWAATPSSDNLRAAMTDETGSGGGLVFATSPTLTTPVLGAATATSINKLAITAPATSATLAVADGKTFTASNTLTLSGTDGSTLAIGTGGTLGSMAYQATSSYITTTSATTALNGKLGNVETGASTTLALGAIADGQYLIRSGTNIVGDSAGVVSEFAWGSLPSASANNGRVIIITGLGNRKVLAQSNGTRWLPLNGRQLINSATPYATVTGATTELAFSGNSYTSPIGFLAANDSLVIRPTVNWSATTGNNTFRVKISGTSIYTPAAAANFTSRPEIEIFADNSTAAQWVPVQLATAAGMSTTAAATFSVNTATTAITVDFFSQAGDAATVATLRTVDVFWVTR
ncbi:MAG: hypothetical protein NTZ11_18430 [Gammaproteobacteria bacterium]|nr:hypothetical protein [Gammaproteobacteria bacterium]